MAFRTWIALSLAALAAVFAEASARACSPPFPGLHSTLPKDGSTYPGNAAVIFRGFGVSLDEVTVTVDGQPASFGPAPAPLSDAHVKGIMATVQPMPMPGQEVVIEGNFCGSFAMCEPEKLTFTAGPPDTQAPPPMNATSFDAYDYADYKASGGDCTISSDLAYWVDVQAEPSTPEPGDSARFYVVEAFHPTTPDKVEFFSADDLKGAPLRVEFRSLASTLGGAPAPEALCFRAFALDTAGNVTESKASVCTACRYRDAALVTPGFGVPPEPMWTSADVYPEGPCGMGTSSASSGSTGPGSTGGDDIEVGGCGFHVGSGAPASVPWISALVLSAFVFARARRRDARP